MNKEVSKALDECKAVLKSNPGTKKYYDIFEKYWLGTIETELNKKQYLEHFLDTIFDTYDDVEIVGEYDEDIKKYFIDIEFDGSHINFYCDYKEYLFWREMSGVDDQYGPEDLR